MSRIPAHGARGFQWAQLLKAGSPHRFHATVQGFGDHAARQPIRQTAAHHLPPHNELAGVFGANGLDQIICRSVNDAFVMNQWKQDQAAGKPGIRSPHRSRQRRFLYGMLRLPAEHSENRRGSGQENSALCAATHRSRGAAKE